MLTIDTLRLFVDQRLTSATDDIFRLFARTISEYEDEVSQAKREIDRQRRLLEAAGRPGDTLGEAPGDTVGNTPAGQWKETLLCCSGLIKKMAAECVTYRLLFPARCRCWSSEEFTVSEVTKSLVIYLLIYIQMFKFL